MIACIAPSRGSAISGQCSFHHCGSHQCRAGMLPMDVMPLIEHCELAQ
jgi:hypothetical protein